MTVQDEAYVVLSRERNSCLGRFNGKWAIDEFTIGTTCIGAGNTLWATKQSASGNGSPDAPLARGG